MKNLFLLMVVVLSSLSIAVGQPDHGKHKKKHHKTKLPEACQNELKSYYEQNIHPKMQAAQEQFMEALTKEDLIFLNKKREESKALTQEYKQAHKEMKEAWENGATKEEMKAKKEAQRDEMKGKKRAIMEAMKPFLERNKEIISASMLPLREMKRKWRADKEAIIDKYLTEEQKEKKAAHKEARAARKEKHPEKAAQHKKHHRTHAIAKFIFWDGEQKKQDLEKGDETGSPFDDFSTDEIILTNYPNPATGQTSIVINTTTVQKNAVLTITDVQGRQVWKEDINELSAGENKIDIDLANFKSGQYFYTLEANGNKVTKSLLVK